nr:unnamed protein product [Digitaria exilis]
MESYNEDLAIAYFVPEVNKDDFGPMAHDLKDYFTRAHGVHLAEHKEVTVLPFEDPTPPNGPLFAQPYYAPRWMGSNPFAHEVGQGSGGHSPVAQGMGEDGINLADMDVAHQAHGNYSEQVNDVVASPAALVPSMAHDSDNLLGVAADFLALGHSSIEVITLAKVICSFHPIPHTITIGLSTCLSILGISLDLSVPPYIIDERTLFYLASFLPDINGVLIGRQRPFVPYSDDDDEYDEVQVIYSIPSSASHKRKSRNLKRAFG